MKGFDDNGKPILVEKKKSITLRMLLSHTAGFGYTFFNPEIRQFGLPAGIDEFSGRIEDMEGPLLFEPGSKFNYGVSEGYFFHLPHIKKGSTNAKRQTSTGQE